MFEIVVLNVVLDPHLAVENEENEQRVHGGEDLEGRTGCKVIVLKAFSNFYAWKSMFSLLFSNKEYVEGGRI